MVKPSPPCSITSPARLLPRGATPLRDVIDIPHRVMRRRVSVAGVLQKTTLTCLATFTIVRLVTVILIGVRSTSLLLEALTPEVPDTNGDR